MLNGCPKSETDRAQAKTTCYRILTILKSSLSVPDSNHGQSDGQGEGDGEGEGNGKGKGQSNRYT